MIGKKHKQNKSYEVVNHKYVCAGRISGTFYILRQMSQNKQVNLFPNK